MNRKRGKGNDQGPRKKAVIRALHDPVHPVQFWTNTKSQRWDPLLPEKKLWSVVLEDAFQCCVNEHVCAESSRVRKEDEIKSAVSGALENKKKAKETEQVGAAETQEEKLIQKREVIKVLNRTAEDETFWTELMENGSEALQEYHLSGEAKAAIISGDLKWINERVGELTQKQLMFIFKRLEREAW